MRSLRNVDGSTIRLPTTLDGSGTEVLEVELARARHPPNGASIADKNLVFVDLRHELMMCAKSAVEVPTWISSFLNPITAPFLNTLEALPMTDQGNAVRNVSKAPEQNSRSPL